MRRIILVVALVALLVVAAVVPAVADPSPTGLGSIVPTLAKAALPDDVLPASWVSSDEDISAENEEAAENSNASLSSSDSDSENSNVNSLNSSDSDADTSAEEASLNSSDSGSSSSGSSSSSSGSSGSQEFEQEDVESGEASPSVSISNTGDNANLCPAVLQSANTGNVSNQQGVDQYGSETDDIEFEGSSITITPELVSECTQTIEQAGAAGT